MARATPLNEARQATLDEFGLIRIEEQEAVKPSESQEPMPEDEFNRQIEVARTHERIDLALQEVRFDTASLSDDFGVIDGEKLILEAHPEKNEDLAPGFLGRIEEVKVVLDLTCRALAVRVNVDDPCIIAGLRLQFTSHPARFFKVVGIKGRVDVSENTRRRLCDALVSGDRLDKRDRDLLGEDESESSSAEYRGNGLFAIGDHVTPIDASRSPRKSAAFRPSRRNMNMEWPIGEGYAVGVILRVDRMDDSLKIKFSNGKVLWIYQRFSARLIDNWRRDARARSESR